MLHQMEHVSNAHILNLLMKLLLSHKYGSIQKEDGYAIELINVKNMIIQVITYYVYNVLMVMSYRYKHNKIKLENAFLTVIVII